MAANATSYELGMPVPFTTFFNSYTAELYGVVPGCECTVTGRHGAELLHDTLHHGVQQGTAISQGITMCRMSYVMLQNLQGISWCET